MAAIDRWRSQGLRARSAEVELPEDPGELVLAVDAADPPTVTLRLERVDPPRPPASACCRVVPVWDVPGRADFRRSSREPTLTMRPQRALVGSVINDSEWQELFAQGRDLPARLGRGFDERVVEYGWLISRQIRGRVLDAGSVLNHRHVLERLLPTIANLTIATLAPEAATFVELGVSYLYGDVRELPFCDGWFDEVICLSTLEHVGMDMPSTGPMHRATPIQ